MMRYHYNKELIVGTICAGGSLGTIIPPSVVAVVLGPIADVSVGDLLVGMIIPGLIMAGSYILYILVLCFVYPKAGPRIAGTGEDEPSLIEKLKVTGYALVPPLCMIFAVLGSIMLGWAAPTEAAAIGAAGAVLLALFYGRFSFRTLHEAIMKTLTITTMIMTILLAGNMMTGAFVGSGGIAITQQLVAHLALGPWGILFIVLLLAFIAGFFLDWISICLILVPIFAPLLKGAGVDMVWFCILFLVVIQTSYLSPPMAPAIFYFRAISPPEITTMHMYRGVIPFIMLQVVTLAICLIFPATITWLPKALLGP
jgi:tripartite ATP-independent transporter DctM subunit